MTLDLDPAEFAPIIREAVTQAINELQAEQPADDNGKLLLDKRAAAEALSVSPSTVDRLRRDDGLPYLKLNGLVLFRPEALRAWAAEKETER